MNMFFAARDKKCGNLRTTLRPEWALVAAGCLAGLGLLLAGEAVCRCSRRIQFLGNSENLFSPNRFGPSRGNTPEVTAISFGAEVRTDSNGFRIDPDFPDPANGPAVLFLGDSVALGPGVIERWTAVGRVRRTFPKVRMYNASSIGYDARDYWNVASRLLPAHPEIRHVILLFCLNDIVSASAAIIDAKIGPPVLRLKETKPAKTINDLLRSRSKLYLFLKSVLFDASQHYFEADARLYQDSRTFENGMAPIEKLAQFFRKRGINFHVLVLPYEAQLRWRLPPTPTPQAKIMPWLLARGIRCRDLRVDFKSAGIAPKRLFLFNDPMHLSAEGHKVLAGILSRTIKGVTSPSSPNSRPRSAGKW